MKKKLKQKHKQRPAPVIEVLEPRVLFSADIFGGAVDTVGDDSLAAVLEDAAGSVIHPDDAKIQHPESADQPPQPDEQAVDLAPLPDSEPLPGELVLIDPATPDSQQLLDDMFAQTGNGRQLEAVILDANRDGIAQISDILQGRSGLDAIHLISHASDGTVSLGNSTLEFETLHANAGEIKAWGEAFSEEGDFLIYGCNLAASADGQGLVDALSRLTGTDVAASDDLSGNESLGGDWDLEYRVGEVETAAVLGDGVVDDWGHTLGIAIDGTASTGASTGENFLISHASSGTDRVMLVGVTLNYAAPTDSVSSITYNSDSLYQVGFIENGEVRVEIWARVAPDIGTYDVDIRFSGNSDGVSAGVITFTGVDQSTPLGAFQSSIGGPSGTASTTLASAAGEIAFGIVAVDDSVDYNLVVGEPGQAEDWDGYGTEISSGGSTKVGAAAVDMSWSWSGNDDWAIGGVSIHESYLNSAPTFNTLDGTPSFVEDGAEVVFDADVVVNDDELDALNGGAGNYAGASLILMRDGGASGEDIFAFNDDNSISLVSGNLVKNAQIIASFDITTTPGELVVSFTDANVEIPESVDVDNILRQITYANSSDTPPASVQIDWMFDDGNTGSQGSGGALQAAGNITVDITSTNDAPIARPDGVNLSFDGDDFVEIANDSSLQMTDKLTMEAWIKPTGLGNGSQLILNKEGEYELGIIANIGEILFAITKPNNTWDWHYTGQFVTLSEWSHVAVAYDGVAGKASTYINGELVDTFAQSGAIGDRYPTFNDLMIGGRGNDADERFEGQIDEIRVWNTTRSQLDIQSNMDSLLDAPGLDLSGNWRLDEAGGGAVTDHSLFGNHGVLGGSEGADATPSYQGYVTDQNTVLAISAAAGVLSNDYDMDSASLTVTNLDTTGMLGNLTLNAADGSFDYDPNGEFDYLGLGEQATETFTYTANDGSTASNTATVTITITGVEDATVVNTSGETVLFTEDGGATGSLFTAAMDTIETGDTISQVVLTLANVEAGDTLYFGATAVDLNSNAANGPDGDGFTYTVSSAGASPVVTITHAGTDDSTVNAMLNSLVFNNTSNNDPGTAARTVTLTSVTESGSGTSADGTVATVNMAKANDTPVSADDAYTVAEDGTLVTNAWQYQRVLTFENSGRSEYLMDFPVLIKLDNTRIDYAQTQDNGEDLRFFDSTGSQLLPHEIELWNEAGASYVWVKVPTIDAASNTDSIIMVYGNPDAADEQNPAGVWGNDYDLIYHLNDATGINSSIDDSVVNNYDVTNQGTINSSGVVADAKEFDGTTYIDLGSNLPVLNGATAATLSAWINPDAVNGLVGTQQLVNFSIDGGGPTPSSRVAIALSGNQLGVLIRPFDNATEEHMLWTTGGPLVKGLWQQVTATVDIPNDTIEVYVDGVLQTLSGTVNFPTATAFLNLDSSSASIGGEDDGSGSFFVGKIDEVRLATTSRSADWLDAQSDSITDNGFVLFGTEQVNTRANGILVNDTDPDSALSALLVTDVNDGSLALNPNGSFTYTPDPDFQGVDSFAYRSNDGTNSSNIATMSITVTNVDDAPVISGDTGYTGSEGDTATGTLAATDADGMMDLTYFTIKTQGTEGTAGIDAATGAWTFTPSDLDWFGSDSFEVTITDDLDGTTTQIISIDLANVNDTSIANADAYSVDEDGSLAVGWWDSDWTRRQDITFDNLAQSETLTDFPVLIVLNSGDIDYSLTQDDGSDLRFFSADGTPLAYEIEQWNEGGDSSVWVRVPHITGSSNSDTVTMYYGNASADPIYSHAGVWDSDFVGVWHLNEEQAGTGSSGIYKDATGHGHDGIDRVAATSQGGQVTDGQEFGTNDWIEIDHDASLDLRDSMTISFWIKQSFDSGNFNRVVEKGLWGYGSSYYFGGGNGTNDLTFYLNGQEVIDTADGVLSVGVWQHAAVSYTSNGDGTGTARMYLDGAEIATGNYTSGVVAGNTGRLAIGHSDPSYDFEGYIDEVQISSTDRSADWIAAHYQATNNKLGSEFVQFGVPEVAPATDGVITNDTDIDGDLLTATIVSGPSNAASFTFNKDGTFSYTPNSDFDGVDSFAYNVNDGTIDSNTQTVTIAVNPVNDAAGFSGNTSGSGDEDAGPIIGTLSVSDTADGMTTPNFTVSTDGINGAATIDPATGAWSYSPNADFNDSDTFTVSVTDDDGNVETQVINISVSQINDNAGFSGNTSGTGDEDAGPITGTLSVLDTADGMTTPNFTVSTDGINGAATIDPATGAWSYSPAADFNGSDTFTVSVTDDDGNVETQVASLTVINSDDAPVIAGDSSGSAKKDVDPDLDNFLETGGALTITDPDAGESSFLAETIVGRYGSLTIDAAGNWNYAADNTQANIQQLNPGESIADNLMVTTADGTAHNIAVSISSNEDAPAIGGEYPGYDADDKDTIVKKSIKNEEGKNQESDDVDEYEEETMAGELPTEDGIESEEIPSSAGFGSSLMAEVTKVPAVQPMDGALMASVISDLPDRADRAEYQRVAYTPVPPKYIDLNNLDISPFESMEAEPIRLNSLMTHTSFVNGLEGMNRDLEDALEREKVSYRLGSETVIGITMSVSAGFVSWALRAGSLMAGFMSMAPLWKQLDPLPILGAGVIKKRKERKEQKEKEDDSTGVEEIFEHDESD